jgi:hypothetical protein
MYSVCFSIGTLNFVSDGVIDGYMLRNSIIGFLDANGGLFFICYKEVLSFAESLSVYCVCLPACLCMSYLSAYSVYLSLYRTNQLYDVWSSLRTYNHFAEKLRFMETESLLP